MILILQDIELNDTSIGLKEGNSFDVWIVENNEFLAIDNNNVKRTIRYKIIDKFNFTEHKQEILEYRLSSVTNEDELTMSDIFMHGGFIEKIK